MQLALGALVLSCLLCIGAGYARRFFSPSVRHFAAACASVRIGEPAADVEARFLATGQAVHGWGSTSIGPAPISYQWFTRHEPARWQSCMVAADTHGRVARVDYEAGSDFTACTDAGAYPHRHVLCSVLDALMP